ncbi:Co2 transporter containing CBS domains [hydrothermal vent metagenome]|uniref:Co2 transporter containing CBS domains n=1 Tax=hydrothermal vent metagenome TaxID=652676 RepID=A0A3B0SVA3_9ZZZZ
MTETIILTAIAIVVLLIISAFFSGSETALTAASRARLYHLEQRGSKAAMRVAALVARRERLIGAILLGNNMVNILASVLATSLFVQIFGAQGVIWATLVMTVLVVIFAEVLPKTYAITNPERAALRASLPLKYIVAVFAPITMAVEVLVRRTLALFGADTKGRAVLSAREELRGAIQLHHLEGKFVKDDRDMLGGILDLSDLEVSDVMVHRTGMKMIDADSPITEAIEEVLSSGHTRLPLWRNEPDNIVGVIHAKDILRAMTEHQGDTSKIDLSALATKPWFVPDTTSLTDQLDAFLKRNAHFSIVVDEYGEVMGLVTLEDILEVIVGEIADEHDAVVEGVRRQPNGSVNADGWVTVRDLNRAMDWSLPDEEANTIAGLVIHEAQSIPEVGQIFTFYGYRFEVLRRQRNRITALRITPLSV